MSLSTFRFNSSLACPLRAVSKTAASSRNAASPKNLFSRKACRCLLLVTIFGFLAHHSQAQPSSMTSSKANDDEVYFDSQNREVPTPTVLGSEKMSATGIGKVTTILFDEAKLSLQTATDPRVGDWIGTVRIPVKDMTSSTMSYLQDIRGSLTKDADSRVTVVLSLGGTSRVLDFPYGQKFNGNISRRIVSLPTSRHPNQYVATIVIYAERRKASSALLVQIDSIDVKANTRPK